MLMLEQLFSLIAPHLCVKCQKEGALICSDCARMLPTAPLICYRCSQSTDEQRICKTCVHLTLLDALYPATIYDDTAKEVVRRLKYGRAQAAAHTMAQLMSHRLSQLSEFPPSTIVTYAPTATTRVRIRGYDQASLLARSLAKTLGLTYRPLLVRTGQTRQVGASREERKQQIQQAFIPRTNMPRSITQVILIDDVLTTGATLEAAAAMLKRVGVERVTAVVFAVA
ncbi:MAG: phosphoribosyltransferase family protein [Candidatus Saccharimonadales bacterium]